MIPLPLKIVYTLFVCALVPIYWRQYGPANFLWFSDIALLALVPALWLENALLVSVMAVSVVFFEALWNADFFFQLSTGRSLIGLSAYMFDPKIRLFIRGLSCFHIVLLLLLLWTLHRLGYDQRAFVWQTVVALVVLPLCYLVSNPQANVNGTLRPWLTQIEIRSFPHSLAASLAVLPSMSLAHSLHSQQRG